MERILARQLGRLQARPADCYLILHTRLPDLAGLRGMTLLPHDARAFARSLYVELHRGDASGARWIIVETPPATPDWRGIADRLQRAAA